MPKHQAFSKHDHPKLTSRLRPRLIGVGVVVFALGSSFVACSGGDFASCADTATCSTAGAAGIGGSSIGGESDQAGFGGTIEEIGGAGGESASDGGDRGSAGAAGDVNPGQTTLTTIRVLDQQDKHLVKGASVFIHDADGAVISETLTDTSGSAAVDMTEGQLVSAALLKGYTFNGIVSETRYLSTAFGVTPGGTVELSVYDPPSNTVTPKRDPMTVTVKLTTPLANADFYHDVVLSCGGSQSFYTDSSTVTDYAGCAGQDKFDVYGLIRTGGVLSAFATQYDVPFTPGGNISITLNATNTNISTFKLKTSPITAGSPRLDFRITAHRKLQSAGDLDISDTTIQPGVDETSTINLPLVEFASYTASGLLQVSKSPFLISSGFSRVGPSVSAERDWAPVDDIAIFSPTSSIDATDISRPVISWDLEPKGKLGDTIQAVVTWRASDQSSSVWYVWGPAARSGSFKMPALPEKFSALPPKRGDTFDYLLQHQDLIDVSDYADYLGRHVELGTDNANFATLSQ